MHTCHAGRALSEAGGGVYLPKDQNGKPQAIFRCALLKQLSRGSKSWPPSPEDRPEPTSALSRPRSTGRQRRTGKVRFGHPGWTRGLSRPIPACLRSSDPNSARRSSSEVTADT